MFAGGMWIFYLESALALGMFVFIVWWTLPKKPQNKEPGREADSSSDKRATPSEEKSGNPGNNEGPRN